MEHECLKCNYGWKSHKEKPKSCPRCKRYDWNKEKVLDATKTN